MDVGRRLKLDTYLCESVYSYKFIYANFQSFELEKAIANWRCEIFEGFVEGLNKEEIEYCLSYLNRLDEKVYLEISLLIEEMNYNKKNKKSTTETFTSKIISYIADTFKQEESNEKICTNSKVWNR